MRRGKLPDSNRFLYTPDRCFNIFRGPCEIALFDSHKKKTINKRSARVYLTCSPRQSPVIQALSGSLVAHSSRSFDRCLLQHWRSPCSALGRFLGRLYLTYSTCTPPGAVETEPGDFPALDRWVQTDQYCNPIPGSPSWVLALVTRSLLSCGRWFLTHWRHPQSALGRWCLWLLGRSVVKPKLLDAGLPFVSLKLFSSNWSSF